RNKLLLSFVDALYSRNEVEFERGNFRVKGDTIDIYPAYADFAYRLTFWDDEIDEIYSFDPLNGQKIERYDRITIYPANIFVTSKDKVQNAIRLIQDDMVAHVEYMKSIGKHLEAKRVEDKVTFDLEMIRELGYCSGIENYSRYFDGRSQGSRPFCLIDYFPDDILMVVDESHVTLSQVKAMYGGDHSRKVNLVDYGFRLPSALDNRPLKFEEFEALSSQTIYVSATPSDYELEKSEGVVVEQVIRPTGLLDPQIHVRPSLNQIDDLVAEIHKRSEIDERVLVTTLTKRMAEELSQYFADLNIRCRYIHSDVDTLDRVKIMEDLRLGIFDVLIGVNLLREGLDLPEVSLVAILDADKEGFLRSTRALVQTSGRAARNVNGMVIMYADRITKSMKETIDSTDYRREKQLAYNEKHNITPTQIIKDKTSIMNTSGSSGSNAYSGPETIEIAADPVVQYMSKENLEKSIAKTKKSMQKSAKELDFLQAAQFRDEMYKLEKLLKEKS
ncbi:MAG: excinuclease ABC subunit B, partial [Ancylomarina sp.]